MEQKYESYASLKTQVAELNAELEALAEELRGDMEAQGLSSVKSPMGTFTLQRRKSWKYPQETTDMLEAAKAKQALDQSTGDATFTETATLSFRQTVL